MNSTGSFRPHLRLRAARPGSRADRILRSAVLVSFLLTISVNAWGVPTDREQVEAFPTAEPLVTSPAAWGLFIWAPILLGQLAFSLWQILPRQRTNPRLARVTPWVITNNLCGVAWVISAFAGAETVNRLAGALQALTAVAVYVLLTDRTPPAPTARERWLARTPYGLYLGWLTVATAVALTSIAYDLGLNGGGRPAWGLAATVLLTGVGILAARRRAPEIAAAVAWGLLAIAVGTAEPTLPLQVAAVLGSLAVATAIAMQITSRPGRWVAAQPQRRP